MPRRDPHAITTVGELDELLGKPSERVKAKTIDHIDEHCRAIIALSPFLTIASVDAVGRMDVSPKGDPAGFVHVLDDHTLAIPERPGNRRADTFHNVLETGIVGMIFLVPGMEETLRVNGKGRLTIDPAILMPVAVKGKVPKLALLVDVEEAFLHCAKAPKRARLWDPEAHIDRGVLPTLAEMVVDHAHHDGPVSEVETLIADDYANNVY